MLPQLCTMFLAMPIIVDLTVGINFRGWENFVTVKSTMKITKISTPRKLPAIRYIRYRTTCPATLVKNSEPHPFLMCVSVSITFENRHFTPHRSGQEACCSFQRWICEVEGPNCEQAKSENLELLRRWNGDILKNGKNRILNEVVPFSYPVTVTEPLGR